MWRHPTTTMPAAFSFLPLLVVTAVAMGEETPAANLTPEQEQALAAFHQSDEFKKSEAARQQAEKKFKPDPKQKELDQAMAENALAVSELEKRAKAEQDKKLGKHDKPKDKKDQQSDTPAKPDDKADATQPPDPGAAPQAK